MEIRRLVRLATRVFRSCFLVVAATAGLMAGGSLAVSSVAPAGASLPEITVNCPADNLQDAINSAPAGSTLLVSGTCTGNFYINKDLTLSGPATLDGGGVPTQFGATLNVFAGTVVDLNDIVIQNGVGIDGLGGGLWNSGQLTLNNSTVTHNTAYEIGGVFNMGQLTLNGSTVSHNTATNYNAGGIFNCGADAGLGFLCPTPGSLTLINSTVSNNVGGSGGSGGGIANDPQAVMTLIGSTVSGNTGLSGGGIWNEGTATLNKSVVLNNASTAAEGPVPGGGGGLSSTNTSTTTINNSTIQGNSAAFLGGGIFAGGPMNIHNGIVTGNSAAATGGGMLVWDGPTTVVNSAFSNNSDNGLPVPDNPAGVTVAPANYGGFFTNNPTFTTTHSTYS